MVLRSKQRRSDRVCSAVSLFDIRARLAMLEVSKFQVDLFAPVVHCHSRSRLCYACIRGVGVYQSGRLHRIYRPDHHGSTFSSCNFVYHPSSYSVSWPAAHQFASWSITLNIQCRYFVPWLSPLHPGRILTTFIGLDVLCEVIFGTGASRAANTSLSNAEHEAGIKLVEAGLILLCVMFLLYLVVAVIFHVRCEQHHVGRRIRTILIVVYAAGLLTLERSAFRAAEQFQGQVPHSRIFLFGVPFLAKSYKVYRRNIHHRAAFLGLGGLRHAPRHNSPTHLASSSPFAGVKQGLLSHGRRH